MMATATIDLTSGVGGRRRLKDRLFGVFMGVSAALALIPLALIISYVIRRGWSALSVNLFTKTPAGSIDPLSGGIAQAFLGTLLITAVASLIAVPLGLLAAIYLAEYGRGRLASTVRYVAEVLLSTPSIIAGAFIWATVVILLGSFSALAGALALAFLMWPIITRAAEEILRLVPDELREAALALGVPRWKVILRIVVPTAGAGIVTAIMLAVARGLGETAPLLLTTLGNRYINWNLFKPTDAVTLEIYSNARTPIVALQTIAFGGAFTLLALVLALSIGARYLSYRQRKRLT
jgi:phosphate transport system permease protein